MGDSVDYSVDGGERDAHSDDSRVVEYMSIDTNGSMPPSFAMVALLGAFSCASAHSAEADCTLVSSVPSRTRVHLHHTHSEVHHTHTVKCITHTVHHTHSASRAQCTMSQREPLLLRCAVERECHVALCVSLCCCSDVQWRESATWHSV